MHKQIEIWQEIFENLKDGIFVLDSQKNIIASNQKIKDIFEVEIEDYKNIKDLKLLDGTITDMASLIQMYEERDEEKPFSVKVNLLKGRHTIALKIFFEPFVSKHDANEYYTTVTCRDLSYALNSTYFNNYDTLTQLPNKCQAIIDIKTLIDKTLKANKKFGLVLISIDNFSKLRAILGHKYTDSLIKKISTSLNFFAREIESLVYNINGYEFLFVVPDLELEQEVTMIVSGIKDDLSKLLKTQPINKEFTFSTGASLIPTGWIDVDLLIDNTYRALVKAQENGINRTFINKNSNSINDTSNELTLYNNLKQALKLDEFELYYQPYIDMKTGKILGAEALVRWNHSYLGIIPPREFIPLAKKTGLIVEIDKLVIKKAIKQQKQWALFGYNEIQIALNLTLREVERGDLLSFIKIELNKHKIDPKLINFDISESVTMLDAQITKDQFIALKELGISLALDDFGTGHSSFSHLKDFPLDALKINVSFVSNMIHNDGYQKIVKAIIDISHNFDLKVMAKGVEDTQTYQMLKDYGCDIAQGYYFSKPLPVFDFQELIRKDI